MPPIGCFTATAKTSVIEEVGTHFREELGQDLQLFAGGYYLGGDLGLRADDQTVVVADDADQLLGGEAGPEIGVASTKAFTTQLVALVLLALGLRAARGGANQTDIELVAELQRLPIAVEQVLSIDDSTYRTATEILSRASDSLYLGRGILYPIALEGALKLKEISYLHAEGYPAGEMKHGPIALINEQMPTVAIVLKDHVCEKMLSQVEQAKARGGIVIAVATEGDEQIAEKADHVLYVPEVSEMLSPLVSVIPLQLLAYHIAVRRGADVDKPRNLAKSVTVE